MAAMLSRGSMCLRTASFARRTCQQYAPMSSKAETAPAVPTGENDKRLDRWERLSGLKKSESPFKGVWREAYEKAAAKKAAKKGVDIIPYEKYYDRPDQFGRVRDDGFVDYSYETAGAGVGLMEHEVLELHKATYNHALTPTEDWKTGHDRYNKFANTLLGSAVAFFAMGLATLYAVGYFSLPYSFSNYKEVKIDPRGLGAEIEEDTIPFSGDLSEVTEKLALKRELLSQGLSLAEVEARLNPAEEAEAEEEEAEAAEGLSEEAKEARLLEIVHADLSEEDFLAAVKEEGLLDLVIEQAEAKGNHELAEELRASA